MRSVILAGTVLVAFVDIAEAQTAPQAPAALPAKQQTAASSAQLMAVVGDGLIELKEGRSVDLTKNEVLLTMTRGQNKDALERGQVQFLISGQGAHMSVGQRLNLKDWGGLRQALKDKDKCFLDLIDVVAPKGAPAAATLRFSCS